MPTFIRTLGARQILVGSFFPLITASGRHAAVQAPSEPEFFSGFNFCNFFNCFTCEDQFVTIQPLLQKHMLISNFTYCCGLNFLEQWRYCWLSSGSLPSDIQNRARQVSSRGENFSAKQTLPKGSVLGH